MKKGILMFITGVGIALFFTTLIVIGRKPTNSQQARTNLIPAQAAPMSPEGYTRATAPKPFSFPEDHGPHPDYQTEWWYYTGNLKSSDGRHFGYQLTFFRRALIPPGQSLLRSSDWATSQVYMAHFGLSDIQKDNHQGFERLSRQAAGLSGATAYPFSVWLENWSVKEIQPGKYSLFAKQDGITLDLELIDTKGPILQGDQGYSQKGPDPGNASYYYSLTRLDSKGSITINNEQYEVQGFSWMDHEYSTSALSDDQIGWDWFSIQLDNDYELMVFQIRRRDGSIDPFSSGTLIASDGSTKSLQNSDFQLQVTNYWESPQSSAIYPSGWILEIPSAKILLTITPLIQDQEMNLSYDYWEGAVEIKGKFSNDTEVTGFGYVELTGYAESFEGDF